MQEKINLVSSNATQHTQDKSVHTCILLLGIRLTRSPSPKGQLSQEVGVLNPAPLFSRDKKPDANTFCTPQDKAVDNHHKEVK